MDLPEGSQADVFWQQLLSSPSLNGELWQGTPDAGAKVGPQPTPAGAPAY